MAGTFSAREWNRINALADTESPEYGLPARRKDSVVLGSFNIRKLGSATGRSDQAWDFLARICRQFDLLAIQETQDDLSGIRKLKELLGPKYGLVVSDTTGRYPGGAGLAERLTFLFRWDRVSRTELASDITYDRAHVVGRLFSGRAEFHAAFEKHAANLGKWRTRAAAAKRAGKRAPAKPALALPDFLTFIRTPLCASFHVDAKPQPLEFLAVNAHLLYGTSKIERQWEFEALMAWVIERAKQASRMYYPDMIVLGDMNLFFEQPDVQRAAITKTLKALNESEGLHAPSRAELYLPFLDPHPRSPTGKVLRTNARQDQTFDQIAFVTNSRRLPVSADKAGAGSKAGGFDYGVFNYPDLFARALHKKSAAALTVAQRKALYSKFQFDVSDHMPIWVRLAVK